MTHSAQSFQPSHPRIAALSRERAKRLRVAWFVLGAVFGLALSTLLNVVFLMPSTLTPHEKTQSKAPTHLPAEHKESALQPVKKEPLWPRKVEYTVASGDTLLDLMTGNGLSYEDAHAILSKLKTTFDPRNIQPGHRVSMMLREDTSRKTDDAARLGAMTITLSKIEQVNLTQTGPGAYLMERRKKALLTKAVLARHKIKGSFYETAERAGVPRPIISELIKNFSYDIDFQRDIQPMDTLEILYEAKVTEDGTRMGNGNVLYAMLNTGGKDYKIYRFQDDSGSARFYTEKGASIIKRLLRTPIDGARISSGFGMRKHPILGYSKMHKGLDFSAPTGTPIYAAGDGVIEYAGLFSSYGNYLKIKHNDTWSSAYGHISRFARNMGKGRKVRQGEVVAYVGATGRATGPHLHYELIKKGTQVNPSGVQFAGSDALGGRMLAAFRTQIKKVHADVARLRAPADPKLATAQ
ncbi:MAG: peptidoglycan DD-metalloendopeptidase family protein [Rickettsiales bacterium]|nr:peptidoglycan DD-metalloendopeptidase family protein [Rickettsiales bacterium]